MRSMTSLRHRGPVLLALTSWTLAAAAGAAGTGAVDPGKTDVCAAVPGEAVAAALGGTLQKTRPFRDPDGGFARCTYFVVPAGGGEAAGTSLWLYPAADFEDLVEAIEGPVERPAGLGDAAVLFHEEDGFAKLLVLVRGRYAVEAVAADAESAAKLARAALARL
jgi:hypothetical protein